MSNDARWRAHQGVDYAGTTGTAVRNVGDGVVEFSAGMNRARGNELSDMVKLETLGIDLPGVVLISMAV